MPVRVRRDAPLPIARQIAEQLIGLIQSGALGPDDRLPPVRVLAGFLRVNRNTVAKVYAALEREGWIQTAPGRGTFVTGVPPRRAEAGGLPGADGVVRRESDGFGPRAPDRDAARTGDGAGLRGVAALAPLADRLLAEAEARGVGPREVDDLLAARAALRQGTPAPRVGFVECNPSDLAYFSRQLEARLGLPLTPVLVKDLPGAARSLDIVATTLFHVEEVRAALPRREVIGLMAAPDFRTLDAVAHLPPDSRIALICATQEGVRSKERSIRAVGSPRPRLLTATLHQPDRLRRALHGATVVLASPKVLERLAGQIPSRARVVPFASVLGEGAVQLLEERIRSWRQGRQHGARNVPGSVSR